MALFCSRCHVLLGNAHCAGCGQRIHRDEGVLCRHYHVGGNTVIVHVHATDACDARARDRARKGRPREATQS